VSGYLQALALIYDTTYNEIERMLFGKEVRNGDTDQVQG
jgi:hypothetical protein